MHEIERLNPATVHGVRTEVFDALAEYASGGNHGPIHLGKLFREVADRLVRVNIIERRPNGSTLASLKYSYPSRSFPNYGVPTGIANLIRQTFWELYIQGCLAPAANSRDILAPNLNAARLTPLAFFMELDQVMITPHGVDVLVGARNRIQVYDPEGYLTNFWSAHPPPDPEMMRYLSECILVFRSNHLLATVILLGAASERLVDVLAKSLRDALGSPGGTDWYRKRYRNKRDISERFKALSGKLMGEYGEALNQQKLKDSFQGVVRLTFEEIRLARNDIAHVANRQFNWNEVSGFLHNFVQYFRYVNRIIAFLAGNPKGTGYR